MANMKLVFSMIHYLKAESKKQDYTADTRESLEVAVQCLQTAYDIDSKDSRLLKKDSIPSLEEIFNSTLLPNEEDKNASGELNKKAAAMKNLGNSLMKANQFSEAIRYYNAAIELDSRNAIYYGNRAAAYSKLNDFKNAISDCEKAIEIDPKYAKAYGRMGLAYTSLGQNEKAKEAFKKAVELDPSNESYQTNLKLAQEKDDKPNPDQPQSNMNMNIDWRNIFSNPTFRTMANTLMQDPNLIHVLSAGMSNSMNQASAGTSGENSASSSNPSSGNGANYEMLIEAGQYLANQMQATNPDLVEQLRQTAGRQPPPPPNPDKRDPQ